MPERKKMKLVGEKKQKQKKLLQIYACFKFF